MIKAKPLSTSAPRATHSPEELADRLYQFYKVLDSRARLDFINQTVQMFANYENKWIGEAVNGQWKETPVAGTNNFYLSIPLLTAHVDTNATHYTKTKPKYMAAPYVDTYLSKRLAEMCQEVAARELSRVLTYPVLQKESQNISLATVSYRQIVMEEQRDSPIIVEDREHPTTVQTRSGVCEDCGSQFETSPEGPEQCQNEECMSQNVSMSEEVEEREEMVTKSHAVRLPRPKVIIPNPISMQDDFDALTFRDSRFVIRRRRMKRREAEHYYQIDLSSAHTSGGTETRLVEEGSRQSLGSTSTQMSWLPTDFTAQSNQMDQPVDDIEMWLAPCEYGQFYAKDGSRYSDIYPDGMYVHIIDNYLIEMSAGNKDSTWVRIQHGVRPFSNKGMGLVHLADMNDAINNTISLEYSILRTHGFPIRLLRGRWMSEVPQANQTIIMDKIPEDRDLREAMLTEQPSNTSGLLGILTQKLQGYMQYIGGSINPVGMPSDAADYMGSATAAASFQEMMSDRIGLAIQMRVAADIDTMFIILENLQKDERNKQYFLDAGYDSVVVDKFFECDFRSEFNFEVAKGTDEPRLDSVNTFKVQSFAQLTASLTGLRQFDQATFYDIVAALGETLNIDVAVGAGRAERNLAENRINAVLELYRDKDTESMATEMALDPMAFGTTLYQAVTFKESSMLQMMVQSQIPPIPPEMQADPAAAAMVAQQMEYLTTSIKISMYDWPAMIEAYSDWLQSDAGQSADLPVQLAVGMLISEAVKMKDEIEAREMEKRMQMMQFQAMQGLAAGSVNASAKETVRPKDEDDKKADNPPGPLKRDGTSGPGRPKDVKVEEQK